MKDVFPKIIKETGVICEEVAETRRSIDTVIAYIADCLKMLSYKTVNIGKNLQIYVWFSDWNKACLHKGKITCTRVKKQEVNRSLFSFSPIDFKFWKFSNTKEMYLNANSSFWAASMMLIAVDRPMLMIIISDWTFRQVFNNISTSLGAML